MASKGYPHPNEDTTNYSHPQPPPAYEQSFTQQSHPGNNFYQPVVTQQPIQAIVTTQAVGPDPTAIVCPQCRQHVITRLDFEITTKTHLIAGLLCAFICWPCAWIPYVMDSCKNANHYCPKCGSFIGTYKR